MQDEDMRYGGMGSDDFLLSASVRGRDVTTLRDDGIRFFFFCDNLGKGRRPA